MILPLLSYAFITNLGMSGVSLSGTVDILATSPTVAIETEVQKTRPIIENWKTRMKNKDAQITTFVSKSVSLVDPNYEPSDLVPVGGIMEVGEAGRVSKMRKEARDAMWSMARDFYTEFGEPFVVISAYRSAAYQKRMWDLGKCTDTLCAPPGHSEHQLGLAIDVFDATTETEYYKNPKYVAYVAWLQKNAHKYGYTQSYQKWEVIDEYEVEPWHWRYVGVELATKLKKLKWTLTEYTRFQWIIDWRK